MNMQFKELFEAIFMKSDGSFSEVTCFANECSERHQN